MILTDTDMQQLAAYGRLKKWVKAGDISVRQGDTVRYWHDRKERFAVVDRVYMQTRGMNVVVVNQGDI
jgi:hypothetical protein